MASWREMSKENLAAAGELMRLGYYRSSISRAYYAAFGAVTHALAEQGMTFPRDWMGPTHLQLRTLVRKNLKTIPLRRRRVMMSELNLLYALRIRADYRPDEVVMREDSHRSVLAASGVVTSLGGRA